MKKSLLLLLIFFLAGCVTVPVEKTTPRGTANASWLFNGMSKKEVMGLLGSEVVIGYERSDDNSGTFIPVIVKNPYRAEILRSPDKQFEVLYYFAEIKQPDDLVTDDELLPLVFEYDRFIGQGWDFLKKFLQENNISR